MKIEFTFEDKTIFDTYLENMLNFKIKPVLESVADANKDNLSEARSYDGSNITPLKESTKKKKGHDRVFYDTGFLVNDGIEVKILDKYSGEISIKPERDKIVTYLAKGKPPLAGARKAFGFSSQMKDKVVRLIMEQLRGRK